MIDIEYIEYISELDMNLIQYCICNTYIYIYL